MARWSLRSWLVAALLISGAVIAANEGWLAWKRHQLAGEITALEDQLRRYSGPRSLVKTYKKSQAELERKVRIIDSLAQGRGAAPAAFERARTWREQEEGVFWIRVSNSLIRLALDSVDPRQAVRLAEESVEAGALEWADVDWVENPSAGEGRELVLVIRGTAPDKDSPEQEP